MAKLRRLTLLLLAMTVLTSVALIAGCDTGAGSSTTYSVKFLNHDETVLQWDQLAGGAMPEYIGATPTKEGDAQYSYVFTGWDKEITSVSGDVVYTATYESKINEYSVKFVNFDGTELQAETLEYGAMPEYKGEAPVRESDAQHVYTFAGWGEIVAVVGDTTYTAIFDTVTNKYLVKFVTEAGEVLQEGEIEYGAMPQAPVAELPENTAQYSYAGAWDREISEVTGEATYTWKVTATVNKYLVKFVTEAGEVLQEGEIEYGAMPQAPVAELPENTAQYSYAGAWDKEISEVTGEATYTWKVTATKNKYTVSFVNDNGDLLQGDELEFGATPKFEGEDPVKASDEQYAYVFKGWDKEITAVVGEAVYTAVYEKAPLLDGSIDAEFYGGDRYKDAMHYSMMLADYGRNTAEVFVYTYVGNNALYVTFDFYGPANKTATYKTDGKLNLSGSGMVLMVKNAEGEGKYFRAYANGILREMPLANVIANNNGFTGATTKLAEEFSYYGLTTANDAQTGNCSRYTMEFAFDFEEYQVQSAEELSFVLGWLANDGWECGYSTDATCSYIARVSATDETVNYVNFINNEKSWWSYNAIQEAKGVKSICLDGEIDPKYQNSITYVGVNSKSAEDVTTTTLHWYDDVEGKALYLAFEVDYTVKRTINNASFHNTPGSAGVLFAVKGAGRTRWCRAYSTNISYKDFTNQVNFYSCKNTTVDYVKANYGTPAKVNATEKINKIVIEVRVDYAFYGVKSSSELSLLFGGIHHTSGWTIWHYNRVTGGIYEFGTGDATAAGHVTNVNSDYYWTLAQLEAEMAKQANA